MCGGVWGVEGGRKLPKPRQRQPQKLRRNRQRSLGLRFVKLPRNPQANLEKVTILILTNNQLTDVKGLEKLTKLERLGLKDNPVLTKAQIDELQKALPKCEIRHNAK